MSTSHSFPTGIPYGSRKTNPVPNSLPVRLRNALNLRTSRFVKLRRAFRLHPAGTLSVPPPGPTPGTAECVPPILPLCQGDYAHLLRGAHLTRRQPSRRRLRAIYPITKDNSNNPIRGQISLHRVSSRCHREAAAPAVVLILSARRRSSQQQCRPSS